jgi:hypothetical protein
VCWTAEDPYAKHFADINMLSEARYRYSEFVRENLSRAGLDEILYGFGGSKVNFGA